MRSQLNLQIERLKQILSAHGQPFAPEPGASESELRRLEDKTGIRFDRDFKDFYRFSNGSGHAYWGAVFPDGAIPVHFLPLETCEQYWPEFAEHDEDDETDGEVRGAEREIWDPRIKPYDEHKYWFPFATLNGSTLVYYDADPAPTGTYGQIIVYQHDPDCVYYAAGSFIEFLQQSNQLLETDAADWFEDESFELTASASFPSAEQLPPAEGAASSATVTDDRRPEPEADARSAEQAEAEKPGWPLADGDIAAFERKYGLALPQDYKAFLLRRNGGRPEKRRFTVLNAAISSHAMYYLPLDAAVERNLERFFVELNRGGIIPGELLPIATTPRGSFVCLALTGANRGCVYFWDRDDQEYDEEDGLKPSYNYMYLAAADFADFVYGIEWQDKMEQAVEAFVERLDGVLAGEFRQVMTELKRETENENEECKEEIKKKTLVFLDRLKECLYSKACVSRFSLNKWKAMAEAFAAGGPKSESANVLIKRSLSCTAGGRSIRSWDCMRTC
ncbi:SMI1/KNR4 family protein [Paenibacillus oleatilyticus]|uniref:SMI1/KNR4 family protein n=1 Tax=Paenibacillus oleatilyticus TaxID=2594886 RepID=UPI001C1FF776|nr:SMI1/KNR4 family protein [Paenibacillus oleatilyticus]MBU7314722.1 SMI1/KNR4 family protein [Paenibacillus oleatilyticus]